MMKLSFFLSYLLLKLFKKSALIGKYDADFIISTNDLENTFTTKYYAH